MKAYKFGPEVLLDNLNPSTNYGVRLKDGLEVIGYTDYLAKLQWPHSSLLYGYGTSESTHDFQTIASIYVLVECEAVTREVTTIEGARPGDMLRVQTVDGEWHPGFCRTVTNRLLSGQVMWADDAIRDGYGYYTINKGSIRTIHRITIDDPPAPKSVKDQAVEVLSKSEHYANFKALPLSVVDTLAEANLFKEES